jgi:hypothetical protein
MKNFFNKNRFFVVSGLITLVISLILIFVIYQTNIQGNSANQALINLKNKIKKLNNYRPSPTGNNIEKIKENLKYVKNETSKLEEYFGAVYSNALNAFIKVLMQPATIGTEKERDEQEVANTARTKNNQNSKESEDFKLKEEFLTSWIKFIAKQRKLDEFLEPSEVLEKFRIFKNYPEDKFISAKNIFAEVYSKSTVEEITENNLDDYILAALGLPLDFTRISCKKFVDDIQEGIEKELKMSKLLSSSEHLKLFDEFTTIPNDDQIPCIIKYCRFYEDLFDRIANSNIDTLVSYKKLNGLRGEKSGDFLIFKYEIKIISSLKSARMFLNSLQNAYKNNRIYVIKDINIKNMSSKADKLQSYGKKVNSGIDLDKMPQKNSLKKESSKQSNNKQIVILLGASNLVSMNIKFDYIIYDNPLIKI